MGLVFFVGYGIAVVAHELGHYAVGKLLRLSPRLVSIGAGPLLLRARAGGTLFELRAVPLAGYVLALRQRPRRRAAEAAFALGGVLGNAALFAAMGAMSAARLGDVAGALSSILRRGDVLAAEKAIPL